MRSNFILNILESFCLYDKIPMKTLKQSKHLDPYFALKILILELKLGNNEFDY
jgi:hypothetical protein